MFAAAVCAVHAVQIRVLLAAGRAKVVIAMAFTGSIQATFFHNASFSTKRLPHFRTFSLARVEKSSRPGTIQAWVSVGYALRIPSTKSLRKRLKSFALQTGLNTL
jgi:hypothetical protein